MQKDITLKPIIKKLIKPLSKYFFNLEINTDNIIFLDKELDRIEKREADIVANINNEYILHIEIQNAYDKYMPQRMLRYYLDISQISDLPIRQYCIYIGKGKNYIQDNINVKNLNYNYTLIDTRNIDCEYLLNEPTPEAKVLAILCDFKDKNPREVIGYIIDELKRLLKNEQKIRNFLMMLDIFSTNRGLEDIVKEESMLRTMTYEDLPSYHAGIERGIERGFMQSKIEDAIVMIKKFNINPKMVAKELGVSLDLILKRLKSES